MDRRCDPVIGRILASIMTLNLRDFGGTITQLCIAMCGDAARDSVNRLVRRIVGVWGASWNERADWLLAGYYSCFLMNGLDPSPSK